jgi:RNA polymerase sigma factor (sigma-70 family)
MQLVTFSSQHSQSEQLELINIARCRVTSLDIRSSDRAISKLFQLYERCLWKLTHSIFDRNADEYFHLALDGFHKAINSFKFIGTFSGWVVYKVKKFLLDGLRNSRKDEQRLTFVEDIELSEICSIPQEDLTEVRNAIAQLTDCQQAIFALHTEGYSWTEIGQIVGKSPDAARMMLRRAIESIRGLLGIQPKPTVSQPPTETPVTWMRLLWDRFVRDTPKENFILQDNNLPRETIGKLRIPWILSRVINLWCYSSGLAIAMLPIFNDLSFVLPLASTATIVIASLSPIRKLFVALSKKKWDQKDKTENALLLWEGVSVLLFMFISGFCCNYYF